MLEADLHQLRQRVQPRDAVVDLEDGLAARLEHAPALVDQPLRIGGVLDDAVRVDEVERVVGKRQTARRRRPRNSPRSPCCSKLARASSMADAARSTPVTIGAALGEAGEIDAGAAADFENRSAAVAVKVDEPQQMVELFEMILIEIVEEPARSDRMPRDLEVVNVPVPVLANLVGASPRGKLYRSCG